MATICPECNKDDKIQKVSSIVLGGTSSGTYSGPSGGVTYNDGKFGTVGGYSTLHGTSQTSLAKMLTPPDEPQLTASYGCSERVILLVLGIVACVAALNSETGEPLVVFAGIGIPLVLWIVLESRKNKRIEEEKKKVNRQKDFWKKAMEKWMILYYCERNDIVFDPQTGRSCHPVEIVDFIYSFD